MLRILASLPMVVGPNGISTSLKEEVENEDTSSVLYGLVRGVYLSLKILGGGGRGDGGVKILPFLNVLNKWNKVSHL